MLSERTLGSCGGRNHVLVDGACSQRIRPLGQAVMRMCGVIQTRGCSRKLPPTPSLHLKGRESDGLCGPAPDANAASQSAEPTDSLKTRANLPDRIVSGGLWTNG